ncbi:hypothetical protein ACJX0J_035034, partial [Zea mays]
MQTSKKNIYISRATGVERGFEDQMKTGLFIFFRSTEALQDQHGDALVGLFIRRKVQSNMARRKTQEIDDNIKVFHFAENEVLQRSLIWPSMIIMTNMFFKEIVWLIMNSISIFKMMEDMRGYGLFLNLDKLEGFLCLKFACNKETADKEHL